MGIQIQYICWVRTGLGFWLTGKLGLAWVHGGGDVGGGVLNGVLYYLLGPDHWGSPGLVIHALADNKHPRTNPCTAQIARRPKPQSDPS